MLTYTQRITADDDELTPEENAEYAELYSDYDGPEAQLDRHTDTFDNVH